MAPEDFGGLDDDHDQVRELVAFTRRKEYRREAL
jgi:hypothetical protein